MEYLGYGDMQKCGVRCFCCFLTLSIYFFSEFVISYICMCTLVEIEPNKRAYVLRDELTMTSVDWATQSDPISLTFSLQTLLLISVDHEFYS